MTRASKPPTIANMRQVRRVSSAARSARSAAVAAARSATADGAGDRFRHRLGVGRVDAGLFEVAGSSEKCRRSSCAGSLTGAPGRSAPVVLASLRLRLSRGAQRPPSVGVRIRILKVENRTAAAPEALPGSGSGRGIQRGKRARARGKT